MEGVRLMGYRFWFKDYLHPDCVTQSSVWVYSRSRPPTAAESLELPADIAKRFLRNHRLHAVVVEPDGTVIEENEAVY